MKKKMSSLAIIIYAISCIFSKNAFAQESDAAEKTESEIVAKTAAEAKKDPVPILERDTKIQTKFENRGNYAGDKISFHFDIPASKVKLVNGETIEAECIPAGLQMRVLTNPNDDGTVRAVIIPGEYIKCDKTKGDMHPLANKLIEINPNFEGAAPRRTSWTYGTLVVPYKAIQGGSKSIKSSTTIGPYAGRSVDFGWFESEFIVFAGPTLIENSFVDNGESKTESLFGIGYGLGFVATLDKEFKMGLVLGVDTVSGDSDYEDNNKSWWAVAIGYEFN